MLNRPEGRNAREGNDAVFLEKRSLRGQSDS